MSDFTYPIVGSKYRPPADDILDVIPLRAPLVLRADPNGQNSGTTHNDPTAIAVYIIWNDQPKKTLEVVAGRVAAKHPDLISLVSESDGWHVGYLPKDVASYLRNTAGFPLIGDIKGEFVLKSMSKLGHVKFSLEEPTHE